MICVDGLLRVKEGDFLGYDSGMDITRVVSKRLREMRQQAGLTQAEVQRRLKQEYGMDIVPSHLSNIEGDNDKLPSLPLLVALLNIYGGSAEYALGRSENPMSPTDIEEELNAGGIGGRLRDVYDRLPVVQQAQVYSFAEALWFAEQQRTRPETPEDVGILGDLLNGIEQRRGRAGMEQVLSVLAERFPGLGLTWHVAPVRRGRRGGRGVEENGAEGVQN